MRTSPATLRPSSVDILLAAATLLVVTLSIAADQRTESDVVPDAWAYVIAAIIAALLLIRRAYPVPVLIASVALVFVYFALDYPPINLALPVAAAMFSTAEAGRYIWAIGAAAVMLLLSSVFRLAFAGQPAVRVLLVDLLPTAAIISGAIALGYALRTKALLRAEERRGAAVLAEQARRDAAARIEEERLLLARDLHDVLAHTVSVMSIQADVAREALEDGDVAAARTAMDRIRDGCGDSIRELRGTVRLLRGEGLRAPTADVGQLDELIDQTRRSGLDVALNIDGQLDDLPLPVRTTAYRVAQEALTNALKHSGASHAEVSVRRRQGLLEVAVSDDGPGGARPEHGGPGGGHGLRGIHERAELLGGKASHGPATPTGFQVTVQIPI